MMTSKQKQVVQVIAEKGGITGKDLERIGYSKSVVNTPAKATRTKAVQSELAKVLKKHNITLKRAIKPIDDALEATKTVVIGKGEESFADTIIDHQTRLRASEMAMKLLQINQPEIRPKEQSNLAPELAQALQRGDIDEIQRIIFNKADNSVESVSNSSVINTD